MDTVVNNRKGGVKIYLLPGASATGRDFLLEQLINNAEVVGEKLGLGRPVSIKIAPKTTTRPSRKVELLKICVSRDDFTRGLENGEIIAPYILESNGEHYGYHLSAFESGHDADVVVADASVYQIPDLKEKFGDRLYVAAMIADRDYREKNLNKRGSENPDEVRDRLNLGDAHVAVAMLMAGKGRESFSDFIHPELAGYIRNFIDAVVNGGETGDAEAKIEKFTKSANIAGILRRLAAEDRKIIDEIVVVTDEHRIDPETSITETKFFELGLNMLRKAIRKA